MLIKSKSERNITEISDDIEGVIKEIIENIIEKVCLNYEEEKEKKKKKKLTQYSLRKSQLLMIHKTVIMTIL